ncbi:uncharacterized protein F4807DRAFT_233306 [Annulohypoxylon truncatum]|uniref:uncharacterized protein n=1 Tax=Annulohypoxylon truncatum TaxID=327061 RepID=UPI002007AA62|nr:uncharacterized protein F4807DRAFT_233306 [Annulohypoxylon truncatum]KAI1206501.1 hypothetical protein F4807DRAFT_233306 [Annulohypoxylon truncatum]
MANNTDDGSRLASLNSATLGAEMPQITLPDGTKVQTGTVGALLINIRTYNEAYKAGDKGKLAQLEEAMRATLPLLGRVGMFDLFSPEEWIQGDNEGRRVVGKLYQQFKSEQK